jgi:predicted RNA-binding protein with PUA-like domain
MEFVPLFKIQFFDPSLRYLDPKSDVESARWIRFHASLIKTYHIISLGSKYLSMGPNNEILNRGTKILRASGGFNEW